MRINHNISSMTATSTLYKSNKDLGKSLEKLSTGLRINDPAMMLQVLQFQKIFAAQIRGASQAQRNAMDGTSMLQIAEGAANEISDVLAENARTFDSVIQRYINKHRAQLCKSGIQALRSEIDRIANVTNYNGKELISNNAGRFGTSGASSNNVFWIDAGSTVGTDSMTISIDTLTASSLECQFGNRSLTTQIRMQPAQSVQSMPLLTV